MDTLLPQPMVRRACQTWRLEGWGLCSGSLEPVPDLQGMVLWASLQGSAPLMQRSPHMQMIPVMPRVQLEGYATLLVHALHQAGGIRSYAGKRAHLFLRNQADPPAIRDWFIDMRPMRWFCTAARTLEDQTGRHWRSSAQTARHQLTS